MSTPSYTTSKAVADHVKRVAGDPDLVVTWVHFPDVASGAQSCQRSKFAAVELSSGSIGIAYTAYIPTNDANIEVTRPEVLLGKRALDLVDWLGDPSALPAQRTVSMAVVNALSTGYMKDHDLFRSLDYVDATTALDIGPGDVVGMVGMFPPLVKPVAQAAKHLHVLELNPSLVQSHETWDVSLDPAVMRRCTKIMVTGTVLLNGTIAPLVDLVRGAEQVALIGPTASFLPDPLFDIGFTMVAGSIVMDPLAFKIRVVNGEPWGDAAEKFVITRDRWQGPAELT